jgi:hypothetical protein
MLCIQLKGDQLLIDADIFWQERRRLGLLEFSMGGLPGFGRRQ